MNWFIAIQAALCVGGSAFEFSRGNVKLGIVYLAWSVSNGAMAFVGSK